MEFNNSWLGYDLPFEEIESQPEVRALRANGIEKRVKAPEHHVTVGHFESVRFEDLNEFLANAEALENRSFAASNVSFDGCGRIEQDAGVYVYFSPSDDGADEARRLKQLLAATPFYNADKNCRDLHLSIGGPDPFSTLKPKQSALAQPFSAQGRLVFVGHDGRRFRKFAWNGAARAMQEVVSAAPKPQPPRAARPAAPITPIPVKTIAIFPKIQPDTAAAVFLLRKYGQRHFPGIAEAEVVFMTSPPAGKSPEELEREGLLLIDLGGSRFDHHTEEHGKRTECASSMIAKYLGVDEKRELKKLLTYAKRDDLEGKGTVSTDPLDRAFGLSGIIMTLNRVHNDDPKTVLDFVLSIFEAHVYEEWRRAVEMPAEWKALKASGKAKEMTVTHGGKAIRLIAVESDNISLPGFLRAYAQADLVIQRASSGHTNLITRQGIGIDLKSAAAMIRREEARLKGLAHDRYGEEDWTKPNRLDGIDEWFFDTAANTLQNGGVRPQGITPTKIALEAMIGLATQGLQN